MKKTSKFSLLILSAFLLSSIAFVSCNNSGDEKKEAPKDSIAAPKMDSTPVKTDSLKVDSTKGNGKPNPMGS